MRAALCETMTAARSLALALAFIGLALYTPLCASLAAPAQEPAGLGLAYANGALKVYRVALPGEVEAIASSGPAIVAGGLLLLPGASYALPQPGCSRPSVLLDASPRGDAALVVASCPGGALVYYVNASCGCVQYAFLEDAFQPLGLTYLRGGFYAALAVRPGLPLNISRLGAVYYVSADPLRGLRVQLVEPRTPGDVLALAPDASLYDLGRGGTPTTLLYATPRGVGLYSAPRGGLAVVDVHDSMWGHRVEGPCGATPKGGIACQPNVLDANGWLSVARGRMGSVGGLVAMWMLGLGHAVAPELVFIPAGPDAQAVVVGPYLAVVDSGRLAVYNRNLTVFNATVAEGARVVDAHSGLAALVDSGRVAYLIYYDAYEAEWAAWNATLVPLAASRGVAAYWTPAGVVVLNASNATVGYTAARRLAGPEASTAIYPLGPRGFAADSKAPLGDLLALITDDGVELAEATGLKWSGLPVYRVNATVDPDSLRLIAAPVPGPLESLPFSYVAVDWSPSVWRLYIALADVDVEPLTAGIERVEPDGFKALVVMAASPPPGTIEVPYTCGGIHGMLGLDPTSPYATAVLPRDCSPSSVTVWKPAIGSYEPVNPQLALKGVMPVSLQSREGGVGLLASGEPLRASYYCQCRPNGTLLAAGSGAVLLKREPGASRASLYMATAVFESGPARYRVTLPEVSVDLSLPPQTTAEPARGEAPEMNVPPWLATMAAAALGVVAACALLRRLR